MSEKIRTVILIIGVLFIFIPILCLVVYSFILKKKIQKLEQKLPKKGEKCFCYIYHFEQGDNGSIIYYIATYLESQNVYKLLKYQSFTNVKLRCNQVTSGYYYKNKIVLDNKSIDIKDLPQNIIDVFELNSTENYINNIL